MRGRLTEEESLVEPEHRRKLIRNDGERAALYRGLSCGVA